METIINLGIWESKNYHFDWENKVLLEETSSPNSTACYAIHYQ